MLDIFTPHSTNDEYGKYIATQYCILVWHEQSLAVVRE
jgi:hypothetical protein